MLGLDHFVDGEREVVQRGDGERYGFRRDDVRRGRRVVILPLQNRRIGYKRRVIRFCASFDHQRSTILEEREQLVGQSGDFGVRFERANAFEDCLNVAHFELGPEAF